MSTTSERPRLAVDGDLVAKLGAGVLIIPQKPWETMERELAEYRQVYRQVNGTDAPAPALGGWTFVDEDADYLAKLFSVMDQVLLADWVARGMKDNRDRLAVRLRAQAKRSFWRR